MAQGRTRAQTNAEQCRTALADRRRPRAAGIRVGETETKQNSGPAGLGLEERAGIGAGRVGPGRGAALPARGRARAPRDGPAGIISGGAEPRRAPPQGQPQAPTAAAGRDRTQARREGRSSQVSAYLALSASALSKISQYSFPVTLQKEKKERRKRDTDICNLSASKVNLNRSRSQRS